MRGADYFIKRFVFAVVTVFVAITINFALFRLAPGSAISNLSRVPHATPETREALKKEFGLDKSRGEQYVLYLKQLAHGNLGVSFANQQPVSSNLTTALENTIPMVLLGTRVRDHPRDVHGRHLGLAPGDRDRGDDSGHGAHASMRCPRTGWG